MKAPQIREVIINGVVNCIDSLHLVDCSRFILYTYTLSSSLLFKVESLLSNGANHSARTDIQGEAPLHLAARHGNVEGLKKLLENNADSNIRDIHGRTPLHLAVSADAVGAFKVWLTSSYHEN